VRLITPNSKGASKRAKGSDTNEPKSMKKFSKTEKEDGYRSNEPGTARFHPDRK
jgi:hypothetical protein